MTSVVEPAHAVLPGAMKTTWRAVDGVRMHAVVAGNGPPVVLVHGYGVSGAYMLPLARLLSGSLYALVPDLPGQGKSESMHGGCGIDELADMLGRWIEAAGLIRPAIVANSMGCQIATSLAVQRPNRVGPMVLIGPTVDPSRRRARRQLLSAVRDSGREPFALLALAARDNASVGIRPLLATARSALADRIEERLPRIEQPTVVVHGEEDGFVGLDWAERAASLLPRGRLVVIPGEPHAVHYTRPGLVAEIVLDLLGEERDDRVRELGRRLQHRDVPAWNEHDAGARQGAVPLLGEPSGHEVVAFAPHE